LAYVDKVFKLTSPILFVITSIKVRVDLHCPKIHVVHMWGSN